MITTKVTSLLFCDNGEEQDCTEELQSNEDKARQVGAAIQELLQSEPTLLPKIRKDLGLEHAVKFQVRYSITPTTLEATSLDGLKVSSILATDLIQAGNIRVIELIRTLFPRIVPQLPPPIPVASPTAPPPESAAPPEPVPVVVEPQGAAPVSPVSKEATSLRRQPKRPKMRKQLKKKETPQPAPPSFSLEAYRADKAKEARINQAWKLFLRNASRFQRPLPSPSSAAPVAATASPSPAVEAEPSVETLFAPGCPFTGGNLHVYIPDLLQALTSSNLPETLYHSVRDFLSFLASQPRHLFDILKDAAHGPAEILGEELTGAVARVRALFPTRGALEAALEDPAPHPDLAFIDTQLPRLLPNYSLPQIMDAWRIYTASPQAIQGEVVSPLTKAPKTSVRPLLPPTILDTPYRVLTPKPPLFPISIEDVSLPPKSPTLETTHPIDTLSPRTIAAHRRLPAMHSPVSASIPRPLVMPPHAGPARELALVTATKPAPVPVQERHSHDLFTEAAALPKRLLPPEVLEQGAPGHPLTVLAQDNVPQQIIKALEKCPITPVRLRDSASTPSLPIVMPPHADPARELALVTATKPAPVQEWRLHDLLTEAAELPKGLLPPEIQESIIHLSAMDRASFEKILEQDAPGHPLTVLAQDEVLQQIIKALENRPIAPLRLCDSASTPRLPVVMLPHADPAPKLAAWKYQQPTILGYSVQPLTPLHQLRNSPFVPTTPRAATTTPPPPALQLPIMEPRGWRFDPTRVQWKPQGGSVPMMGGRVPPLRQTTAAQAGRAFIRFLRLAVRR